MVGLISGVIMQELVGQHTEIMAEVMSKLPIGVVSDFPQGTSL